MRYLLGFVCACALGAGPIMGCNDTDETGGRGGADGAGGSAGADTVTLAVMATEAVSLVPIGLPLEGVWVCETDTENCAMTDTEGVASIVVPANREISYTLEKEGFTPYLAADVTDEALFVPSGPWAMYNEELTAQFLEALGISSQIGGVMVVRAVTGALIDGISEVTFALVDQEATPFYSEANWTPSFELTATTSVGQGGFVDQPTGEYQVELSGAASNCSPQIAWPGSARNQIRVPVRDGYLTFSTMECDEP